MFEHIENEFSRNWMTAKSQEKKGVHVALCYIDINDGDHTDAILFSQIMYWHDTNDDGQLRLRRRDEDGHFWLAKNHDDWFEETRLKRRTVMRSMTRLKERGLIFYQVRGFAGNKTPHIRINWARFEELISQWMASRKSDKLAQLEPEKAENPSNSDKLARSIVTKWHNPIQRVLTESREAPPAAAEKPNNTDVEPEEAIAFMATALKQPIGSKKVENALYKWIPQFKASLIPLAAAVHEKRYAWKIEKGEYVSPPTIDQLLGYAVEVQSVVATGSGTRTLEFDPNCPNRPKCENGKIWHVDDNGAWSEECPHCKRLKLELGKAG